jgi:transposase-like protein
MAQMSMLQLMDRVPDEAAAYQFLESLRWGERPECPHCASTEVSFMNPTNGLSRKTRTGAKTQRRVWQCRACRKQFSVLTGTVMHGTKIPVRTWVFVLFEMTSNKNGVAAREIERRYNLTPRSAWFLTQRIREAMKSDSLLDTMRGTIVADETFIGGDGKNRHRSTWETPVRIVPHKRGRL